MAFASLADELAGAMSGGGPGSSLADEFGLDDLDLNAADGLGASSPYTTPQQPLHPLPGNTLSPQLPPSATSKFTRHTHARNGLPLPLPRASISPAQTRTGKSSTSSYHTAQSSAHAELDEAFDLSMEMGTGLGLGLGLAGELGPGGQTDRSETWNEHEYETGNGSQSGLEPGLGFTEWHEDRDREDVALESRLGDDLAGKMDEEYASHSGQVGPGGPSWMIPKIDKDPIVILQDCLAASSRLLASLRSTDEEQGPGASLEPPRPIHTVAGQRGSVHGGSGGSNSTPVGPASDVEEALRSHLHKLHDAERVREEQLREIVAIGREWAGINWAQGEWMPGWWARERLETGEEEGERADEIGWIGDSRASATMATTATTANDPKGDGQGQPDSPPSKTARRLSLEDHAVEETLGESGRVRSIRDEAEKDPHAALHELLSPADELDELLLAPSIPPPQSPHRTPHQAPHQAQHQNRHPGPSFPYPSPPLAAPKSPLGLSLPNQVHQLIADTPSPALHHLSESLHTATSHSTSLSRTIRGIRAGIEHYRERDTLEEDARRGIEQWEAKRVERGLRGEGGVRAVLDSELEGFRREVDDWGRRMGEVRREAVVV